MPHLSRVGLDPLELSRRSRNRKIGRRRTAIRGWHCHPSVVSPDDRVADDRFEHSPACDRAAKPDALALMSLVLQHDGHPVLFTGSKAVVGELDAKPNGLAPVVFAMLGG